MRLEVTKDGRLAKLTLDVDELSEITLGLGSRCRGPQMGAAMCEEMYRRLGEACAYMLGTPRAEPHMRHPGNRADSGNVRLPSGK